MDPVRLILIIVFLGLVIFVHELGHFLAARWCRVLVERFSIGFGPVLLAFKRGETEYAISAIPLGGYVKMLGQSDTPAVEQPSEDQRSYQNKTVPQRMLIISAGVVMNIIFGLICFAVAYLAGVPYSPATVGAATPGKPAWKAGLQPGDRVEAINGHSNPSYETFLYQVMFTRPESEKVRLDVNRGGEKIHFEISPERQNRPMIGVSQSLDLALAVHPLASPARKGSRAASAEGPAFERGDVVTGVDGIKVATYQEFNRLMFERRRDAVTIDVARQTKEGSSASTASIKVEPARMRSLGLRMTMGDVIAVREGSPAARAVDPEGKPKPVEAGDQIIEIDGSNNFDPMRLADLIADKAGQRVELTVRRKARTPELFKVIVVPDSSPSWNDFPHIGLFPTETAMSVPALGLAYNVGSVVLAVDADGPAGKSGKIQANDVVTKVTYFAPAPPQPAESRWWMRWWNWLSGGGQPVVPVVSKEELESYPFEVKESNWPGAFWGLQSSDVEKVVLQVTRTTGAEKKETVDVELIPSDDASWPFHLRGLNFLDERRDQKASGLLEAVQMGWDYTWTTMSRVYLTLRGLILGDLNPELLSGPLRLGYTAYIVSEDFMTLVRLIGLINVNLAVVNFLPIPVLDGGHMVFLLYEAIFRRKPNEKLLYASYYVGFACILLLMSFVLYLDIKHLWFDRM